MRNVKINKEILEQIISNIYIDACDFYWDGFNISFNCDGAKDSEYIESNRMLQNIITGQINTIAGLNGRIAESEKVIDMFLKEILK